MLKLLSALSAMLLLLNGCQNSRVTNLEQRVSHLEQTVQQLQANSLDDASVKRLKFESCVLEANAEVQRNLDSKGEKQPDGSYHFPTAGPLTEIDRQHQSKLEECSRLYSK